MERLLTSNVRVSTGNIKWPIGKSFFVVNLPLELFRATAANSDTGSLKVSPYFIWYIFGPHADESWTNSYGPKWTKIWALGQKLEFLKNIFDKALTPFCKTFLLLKQLCNGKLLIFRPPSVRSPKIMVVRHV